MDVKKYRILAIGLFVVLVIVIFLLTVFGNLGGQRITPKVPATPLEIKTLIPFVPDKVSFQSFSGKILPQKLPQFRVSGEVLTALSSLQIKGIAQSLSITAPSQSRPSYGGGTTYVFNEPDGRVLTVRDNPPLISYSELVNSSESKGPPMFGEARQKADKFIKSLSFTLPPDWQTILTGSVYLGSLGPQASEVQNYNQAAATKISFGYSYKGYKVVDQKGRQSYFEFIFGKGGTVISARAYLMVDEPRLKIVDSGLVKVRELNDIDQAFAVGEAKAISLKIEGENSDEPVINPPQVVKVKDIESVLVLFESDLLPYYLITTRGALSSGRPGEVLYLLSAAK